MENMNRYIHPITDERLTSIIKGVINEQLLLEHTNDLKPIICIVIGAPGVGKTTWMHTEANRFLFQQFRELDIDHTLTEFQLQTCNEVAEELIGNLSDFEVAMNRTDKNFDMLKRNIQTRLNSKVDSCGSQGMYIDIMKIQLNDRIGKRTLWEWAKNISKIYDNEKITRATEQFKTEFYQTYFKEIFASDFSRRDLASTKYEKRVELKLLGGQTENDEIDYNNDSVCIATLGKNIDDISWYVNQVKHTDSVICVVYLDAPIEVALRQNAQRSRKVSEELIRNNFLSVENTWKTLKKDLSNSQIWRLFRLTPTLTKTNAIRQYNVVENIANQSMLARK